MIFQISWAKTVLIQLMNDGFELSRILLPEAKVPHRAFII